MPPSIRRPVRAAGLTALLLGLPLMALAQQDFEIVRDGLQPAAELRGGDFVLHGTAGQSAVGRAEGAGLRVQGGFHRSSGDVSRIFADGFESRSAPAATEHDAQPENPT